jgi:hypothetical protein
MLMCAESEMDINISVLRGARLFPHQVFHAAGGVSPEMRDPQQD